MSRYPRVAGSPAPGTKEANGLTKFSIAMATCNGAAFLRQQLDSLAAQTLVPVELQIGDDCSSDGTEEIVRQFAKRAPFEVQFHRNEKPLGYGENFIRTALRCHGDWIAFCDQDDVWNPQKLSRCSAEIAGSYGEIALIVHDAEVVDDCLRPTGRRLYDIGSRVIRPPLSLPPEWYALGLTQVFRANLLHDLPFERRVSFPWHDHREAHDVWISLLASVTGSICFLPEPLVHYRRHLAAASTTASARPHFSSSLAGHGEEYSDRSAYLLEVADVLARCCDAAPSFKPRLERAILKLRRQADFLGLRSTAYRGATVGRRLRAFGELVLQGGYFGGSGWPFGAARWAKDLIYAVAGPRSGS